MKPQKQTVEYLDCQDILDYMDDLRPGSHDGLWNAFCEFGINSSEMTWFNLEINKDNPKKLNDDLKLLFKEFPELDSNSGSEQVMVWFP